MTELPPVYPIPPTSQSDFGPRWLCLWDSKPKVSKLAVVPDTSGWQDEELHCLGRPS